MSKVKSTDLHIPILQEAIAAYELSNLEKHQLTKDILKNTVKSPSQGFILEGGTVEERLSIALWYTALLNCKQEKAPCLHCPTCLQIAANVFHDLFLFNGKEETIKIDHIRTLHSINGKPPQSNGKRVILLAEAQNIRVEAANTLLKILEEPPINTYFLLLTPHREQLLSTLTSRSCVITLVWPNSTIIPTDMSREKDLALFLSTGKEWFAPTAEKEQITKHIVEEYIIIIKKALIATFTKQTQSPLTKHLSMFPPAGLLHISDLLIQCESSLSVMVNPQLVLNWLVTKLYIACTKAKQSSILT